MREIKIVTDSTADLPKGMLGERGVEVVPARVILGANSYPDDGSVSTKELFEFAESSGKMPKTGPPSEFQFQEAFQKWLSEDYDVFFIGVSGKIARIVENALSAASGFARGRISIVDSLSVSSGLGLQVLEAAEMAGSGASLQEITEHALNIREKVNTTFLLNTLRYVYLGGKCSRLTSILGDTLNLKPTLKIVNGEVLPGERLSGKNYIEKYLELAIERPSDIDTRRVFVAHCLEGEAGEVKARLEKDYGCNNVLMCDTSSTLSMHGGPGSFGLMYMYK